MNGYEKRKLKAMVYRHGNTIMYVAIFMIATVITIAAASNRIDKVAFVDESQLAYSSKDAVAIKSSDSNKVAATESEATSTEPDTTVLPETTAAETESVESTASSKVKITADTLYVRDAGSSDGNIIGYAAMGDEFEVVANEGEWIKIQYNDVTGYVNAEFAEIVE